MFLPAKTKAKVLFLDDIQSLDTQRKVAQVIPLEQLEQPYGQLQPTSMDAYIDADTHAHAHAHAHAHTPPAHSSSFSHVPPST